MLSFNIIDIFILNQVLPSIFNKVAHKTWHECFVLIKLDSSNSHRQTSSTVVSSHSKEIKHLKNVAKQGNGVQIYTLEIPPI